MDRNIIKGYISFTFKRLIRQKSIYIILLYILLIPYLIIRLNNFGADTNFWNGIYFLLGNRNIYSIFFLMTFLFLVYDIYNDGDISLFLYIRLDKRINWLVSKYILTFIMSIIYSFLIILSVYGGVYLNIGYSSYWSSSSILGNDMYTLFARNVTPSIGMVIYFTRFYLSLLLIGLLEIFLVVWVKSIKYATSLAISTLIVYMNVAILNMRNIPILNIFDISNTYITAYKEKYNLLLFLLVNNIHLIILILAFIALLHMKIKGVELK